MRILILSLLTLVLPAHAARKVKIQAASKVSSSCSVKLTYHNGKTGADESCTVKGSDSKTLTCSFSDSSLSKITHDKSYLQVAVANAASCLTAGGFTIDAVTLDRSGDDGGTRIMGTFKTEKNSGSIYTCLRRHGGDANPKKRRFGSLKFAKVASSKILKSVRIETKGRTTGNNHDGKSQSAYYRIEACSSIADPRLR